MKKIIIKLLLSNLILFLIITSLIAYIIEINISKSNGSYIRIITQGMIYSIITFVILPGYLKNLSPKIKYLKSKDTTVPNFIDTDYKKIKISSIDNYFENLINIINSKWIITYSNKEMGIIKFRRKINLFYLGVGSYLEIDYKNMIIKCFSFPLFTNVFGNKKAKRMNKEIKRIIKTKLNN